MSDLAAEAEKSRAAKIALRNHLLTARRLLSTVARSEAAIKIQDQTRNLVRSVTPSTIAAYVPVGPEPGGPDLPAVLADFARVLLPILLDDGDLDWAEYSGPLVTGPRRLRQPPGARLGVETIRSADLVLVPALAVDRRGMRLGRGGGSYDRALSRIVRPSQPVLALLHEGELIDEVPAEPHDRRVPGVITPTGVFALSQAPEWTK